MEVGIRIEMVEVWVSVMIEVMFLALEVSM